jgi:uncharacterized protein (DUF4415 family)
MSAEPSTRPSERRKQPSRGREDLSRLRGISDAAIQRTSPPELADLPANFWAEATLVVPSSKRAISLRVDEDVLEWFKRAGPRYQSRMNAVLRSYMARMQELRRPRDRRGSRRGAA